MGYKVEVKTYGETDFVSNSLVFKTEAEAEGYAKDLFSRWTLVEEYQIVEIDEKPNYLWSTEGLQTIK